MSKGKKDKKKDRKKEKKKDRKVSAKKAAPAKSAAKAAKPAPKPPAKKPTPAKSAAKVVAVKAAPVVRVSSAPISAPVKKILSPAPKPIGKTDFLSVSEVNQTVKRKTKLPDSFLGKQKKRLLELRDSLLDQMHDMAMESVREKAVESSGLGMHQGDAGSEAYDRDFALTILSQEQDALYEIEEALKRVDDKTYGVCEMSSKDIPIPRLEAIPFARYTVECQAQLEKENGSGRRRWSSETPFADMMGSGDDSEEETEKED
ncbi:MAG: TraR/DksA C4-type zinc finger protein [Verrucomicrobiae bacterium]|nr:TraR/DksA C4-type zinc finger protein [Verrucomicrobiae bacterium]